MELSNSKFHKTDVQIPGNLWNVVYVSNIKQVC